MTRLLLIAMVPILLVAGDIALPAAQAPSEPRFTWPPAVETAFKQKYPRATVKAVFAEMVDGQKVYEIESIDNGRRRDLDYTAEGRVIRYEEELTESELPRVVAEAIMSRYPRAVITRRERLYIAADDSLNFECQLLNAAVSEVVLTPDGQWVTPPAVTTRPGSGR